VNSFFHLNESVPRNLPLSERDRNPEAFYKFLRADFESQRLENARKHIRLLVPLSDQIGIIAQTPSRQFDVKSAAMP
jgi:hypothetical protein